MNSTNYHVPTPIEFSHQGHYWRGSEICLVEWVGAGAPPGHEHGEADGLEDAGEGTDGDGVERALLGEDLGDELEKGSVVSGCSPNDARDAGKIRKYAPTEQS